MNVSTLNLNTDTN